MNVVTCSAKHSPGATMLALALTSALATERTEGPPVLVEVDRSGGDLAALLGLPTDPGLASLAAAERHGRVEGGLWAHANNLPGGGAVVLAPTDPTQCAAAGRQLGPNLLSLASAEGVDAVLDAGRLHDGPWPATPADTWFAVACRPDLAGIEHTRRLVEQLRPAAQVVVVTIGDRPYRPSDASSAMGGIPAMAVAYDPAGTAALLSGPARRARRSAVVRSARTLLDQLPAGALS